MAWDDDMPQVVRSLLQDNGTTKLYRDSDLLQVVLISAMLVQVKMQFPAGYKVSIANETLSPDPTTTANRDDAYFLLTCYTAAVTLLSSEIREMTRQGISIQDGDSKISLQRDSAALGLMLRAYQDVLDDLRYQYVTNGGAGFGEVIVNPYPIFSADEPGYHWQGGSWRRYE
jgi:hypothetical protein